MAYPWSIEQGEGPLVALAIHDGHEVQPEVLRWMKLSEADRLREEDPYTANWTRIAPNRVVARRSRFEVDLNRPREKAVYLTPDDAWGLEVWQQRPSPKLVASLLTQYDAFYDALGKLYHHLLERHDAILVLDLHSYNHRRSGPKGLPASAEDNPQVNVGTRTMLDRNRWAAVIDGFVETLGSYEFPHGPLDVRENIRFGGGHCARWAHDCFPERVCVLSIEVKKFFMDEWTGDADSIQVAALGDAMEASAAVALRELARG
jgi:N-formylglutamate deformylase